MTARTEWQRVVGQTTEQQLWQRVQIRRTLPSLVVFPLGPSLMEGSVLMHS